MTVMNESVFGGALVVPKSSLSEEERNHVDFTNTVLVNKRSQRGEIILTLFEHCNLSCKFCNQNHDDWFGIEEVQNKVAEVKSAIELQSKMHKLEFSIHIMGGEIFQDVVPDRTFDDYFELVKQVHEWANQQDKTVYFGFVSNLIHNKTDRVKRLIDRLKVLGVRVTLMTSYDPASRFNKMTLGKFKHNVLEYEGYLTHANVVLTAPNIKKFLSGDVEFFDQLYERCEIFFDQYTPEPHQAIHSPSDVMMRDIMLMLVDKYPNSYPARDYLEGNRRLHCQSTFVINPDSSVGRCTALLDRFRKDKATNTAGEMEHKFIKDMDCMSCEFLNRCGMGCFQQHFLANNMELDCCWLKDVHRHVEQKNDPR